MQVFLLVFLVFSSFSIRLMALAQDKIFALIDHAKRENIQDLDLSNNYIDDLLLKEIIERLKDYKELSRLNLSLNSISNAGVVDLIGLLYENYRINELYLEDNAFSLSEYKGVDDLRFNLFRNQSLVKILEDKTKLSALQLSLSRNFPTDIVSFIVTKYFETMMEEDLSSNLLGNFVTIPGGEYTVGPSPFEIKGQHAVVVEPFEILKETVKQAYFAKIMGMNPAFYQKKSSCPLSYKIIKVGGKAIGVCADFPVESLSLNLLNRFFAVMNTDPKYGYRLPSGIELDILGAHGKEALSRGAYRLYNPRTYPVKYGPKNIFGVYPSSVAEWAQPEYEIASGGQHDAQAYCIAFGGQQKIIGRHIIDPRVKDRFLGFRVVRFKKDQKKGRSYAKKIKEQGSKQRSKLKDHIVQLWKNQ